MPGGLFTTRMHAGEVGAVHLGHRWLLGLVCPISHDVRQLSPPAPLPFAYSTTLEWSALLREHPFEG